MRLFHPSPLPVPLAVHTRSFSSRPGDVIQLRNPRALKLVRDAVNKRAIHIHATERRRLHAVSVGMQEIQQGRSTGWAITAAIRYLRGADPVPHHDAPHCA